MRWTRASFVYLVGYLTGGGLGLMLAPQLAVGLLGATGSYSDELLRLSGAFLLSLAIFVIQIARHRAAALYPTTLIVRVVILCTLLGLFLASGDRLYLVLSGIVGLGMVLTITGLVVDRRAEGDDEETT